MKYVEDLPGEAQGVIAGMLLVRLSDRITVGGTLFFLHPGVTCDHALGTILRVVYVENEARRKEARHITQFDE